MVKLNKFYDLISRNATVTLTNSKLDKTYYEGSARSIPAEYDDCTVEDFCMSNTGDLLFKIKVVEKKPVDSEHKLWREGALRVYDESYHYWAKVYDTGSQYGIDGGRVSKLTIKRNGESTISPRSEHIISNSLLTIALNVFVRGIYLILMTGRPFRSSV